MSNINVISHSMKPGTMASAALLLLAGLTYPGCASEIEYLDVVQQTEMARAEIEKTRAESTALEDQLKALEAEVASLSSRSDELSDEIQRLQTSQADEQNVLDETLGRLHNDSITLTGQNRTLQHDYDAEQKAAIMLVGLVQRYARELEASEGTTDSAPMPMQVASNAQSTGTPAATTSAPTSAVAAGASVTIPPAAPRPAVTVVSPITQPAATGVNQSVSEQSGWFAAVMSWILAIWHLIF
jgi:cell division protein FtsB